MYWQLIIQLAAMTRAKSHNEDVL